MDVVSYALAKNFTKEQIDESNLKGEQGIQGNDGFSPLVSVTKNGTTTTITITDKNGSVTENIYDGDSAYVLARHSGYKGTESDLSAELASLEGLTAWLASI